jgi:outer membrane autotransporter protein
LGAGALSPASATVDDTVARAMREFADTPLRAAIGEYIGFVCANAVLDQTPGSRGRDTQLRCDAMAGAVLGQQTGEFARVLNGLSAVADDEHPATRTNLEPSSSGARLGGPTGSFNFTLAENDARPGAFSWSSRAAGDADSAWNGYVNGSYNLADQDTTDLEVGFESDDFGFMAGADYEFSETFLLGGAFSFGNSDADINNDGGSVETDVFGFYGYASYNPNEFWYFDGTVSYSTGDHEQRRNVRYTEPGTGTSIDVEMLSETDSDEFAVSFTAGYNLDQDTWVLNPYARFDYADTNIDAFTEDPRGSGAGAGLALAVEDQDFESVMTTVGVLATGSFSGGYIGMLYPYLFAEYTHEFENDNDPLVGKFVTDPAASGFSFALPTEEPDRNYFNFGIGVTAAFTETTTGFARYQGLVGYEDLEIHAFEIGIRQAF